MVQVLTVAGMFGMFFMGSLYLQLVQGYDALQIGLAFLPVTIIMGTLTARYSEPLIMRLPLEGRCSPVSGWLPPAWCCSRGLRSTPTTSSTSCRS